MRRIGERRQKTSSLKGMTLGLLTVFLVGTFCIWRQDKLIDAALGTKDAVEKVIANDQPIGNDRDLLNTIITKALGGE